jgi:hypothetical protein
MNADEIPLQIVALQIRLSRVVSVVLLWLFCFLFALAVVSKRAFLKKTKHG